jgi:hypothetical protein
MKLPFSVSFGPICVDPISSSIVIRVTHGPENTFLIFAFKRVFRGPTRIKGR